MAKKPKLTTKPHYKSGYDAAKANQPRTSPHRDGSALELVWHAGWDAYMDGGKPPEEPRKKRTKAEMDEARSAPFKSMLPEQTEPVYVRPSKPRTPGLTDKLFELQDRAETETDPELLELITMEHADLEWLICIDEGPKPSERWEDYKRDEGLNFDRQVA